MQFGFGYVWTTRDLTSQGQVFHWLKDISRERGRRRAKHKHHTVT